MAFTCISCDNSLELPGNFNDSVQIQLAKTPDILTYSGNKTFINTFETKNLPSTYTNAGDGFVGNNSWNNKGAESLKNITDSERQAVLDAIAKRVTGSKISENIVFPWNDFFLQDVISGQNGNWDDAGSNGTSSSSYTFEVYNKGAKCNQQYWAGNDYDNYEEVTNSAHLNNYYQKVESDGSQTRINETTLMTNIDYGTYKEVKGKQFRWFINCHENLHWYEYIVVKVDNSYYICFDFGCGYPENDIDGHAGKGAEHNDWDYNDWVLKITPAGNQSDVLTEEAQEDPKPEIGDLIDSLKAHVEINLSIEEHEYLASHLSIHVRDTVDVRVRIPISSEYYCEADDMAIVQKHESELLVHGGPYRIEYNIDGNLVYLNIEFNDDCIEVWTEGMNNPKVLEYLRKENNDGLTFEVWNYFNDTAKDILKENLDRSLVYFTPETELYVNAFNDIESNDTESNDKFESDCTVSINENQKGTYPYEDEGLWFNDSKYNKFYSKDPFEE